MELLWVDRWLAGQGYEQEPVNVLCNPRQIGLMVREPHHKQSERDVRENKRKEDACEDSSASETSHGIARLTRRGLCCLLFRSFAMYGYV